jgi:hypothetical protein
MLGVSYKTLLNKVKEYNLGTATEEPQELEEEKMHHLS